MSVELPLVSIVIPTYNDRHYICDAVDSALAQTYSHCEVLVVDDGSDDGTGDLLSTRYGDHIRYVYQENRGLSAARNTGTHHAHGVFINYCDADDKLLPEKVERCLEVFAQQPDAGVVYTDYDHVADDGITIVPRQRSDMPSGDIFCALLTGPVGNFIHEAAPLVRRDLILAAEGFNEDLRAAEDWDMWLRLAARTTFVHLPECLTLYRQRPNAMHTDPVRMAEARLLMFQLAREYPGRERCLDDAAYDQHEASRFHILGMVYWKSGRRVDARSAFRAAIRLDPAHSTVRRLYVLMSYVLPAESANLLHRLRGK